MNKNPSSEHSHLRTIIDSPLGVGLAAALIAFLNLLLGLAGSAGLPFNILLGSLLLIAIGAAAATIKYCLDQIGPLKTSKSLSANQKKALILPLSKKPFDLLPAEDSFIATQKQLDELRDCLLYTSPSPRDQRGSRMPSSA